MTIITTSMSISNMYSSTQVPSICVLAPGLVNRYNVSRSLANLGPIEGEVLK